MKTYVLLVAVAIMLVCAAGAFAYPTIDMGASGVVALPTAEIAPQGTLELAIDRQQAASDWDVNLVRINWGVAKNLEVHAAHARWISPYSWQDDETVCMGGLKYQIPMSFANVAIGGSFGRDKWDYGDMDITKAYLAISKDVAVTDTVNARLTAGGLYSKFDEPGWNYDFTKPYVALELMHNRGITLAAEYRWRDNYWDDEDAPFSTVLRYTAPEKPIWVEVGTTNMSYIGESWDNQRGFIGIGCAFGN